MRSNGVPENFHAAVDRWVVDETPGNGNDFVGISFEEADLRVVERASNCKLRFPSGGGKPGGTERERRAQPIKIGKNLLLDGRIKEIFIQRTAGTEREVEACGKVVHNVVHRLFMLCRRFPLCRKSAGFERAFDKL